MTRAKVLGLLRDYNAWIEIVYLEPAPDDLFRRNRDRPDAVPDATINHLARKMEPPEPWEAHRITRAL